MEVKSEERPQQEVCSRAGDETEGLELEEQRERCKSSVSLLASLVSVACGFPGVACSWGSK